MLWLGKHARLRNSLSPYLDGRLTSADVESLEAHLASCAVCRRELEELRATVADVRELPEVEAPRSFAITSAMLERRSRAQPVQPAPLFANGLRLAGAAVALALAVVLVGDLTFVGGDGRDEREAGSQPATESRTAAEFDAGLNAEQPSDDAAAQGRAAPTSAAGAAAPASCPSPAQSGGSAGGGAGGAAGGGGFANTPPPLVPSAADACATTLSDSGVAAPVAPQTAQPTPVPPATAENSMTTGAASESSEDGGVAALRFFEIALATVLVLLLAAIAIEAAKRGRTVR